MTPELNSIGDLENAADQEVNGQASGTIAEAGAGGAQAEATEKPASLAGLTEPGALFATVDDADHEQAGNTEAGIDGDSPDAGAPQAAIPGGAAPNEGLLSEIALIVQEIAGAAERYHTRAEQREGVIDYLRAELETLRRGERRGLLRPVLTEMCRLRNDLLKQAATLPGDFDAARAAELLRSYAETIELTLESNGVVTYTPDDGDSFNPRMHRRVSSEPTADPGLAGHIAAIRRDGYLDIEANSPIAPAEVTVYAVTKGETEQ